MIQKSIIAKALKMLNILILLLPFISTVKSLCKEKSIGEDAVDLDGPVEYEDEYGKYIIIDDMYIIKDPTRAGLVNNAWPNGIVPYSLDGTLTSEQVGMIKEAISDIEAKTCIQFKPAKKSDKYSLLYENESGDSGCHSIIGFANRKNQAIQFSEGCSKGNAVHETIHALGFYHEHVREDRDKYIKVNCDNIIAGKEHNFNKLSETDPGTKVDYFGVRYNFESIMHYGLDAFSNNDKNTIDVKSKHPPAIGDKSQIGQRSHLSQGDIDMINEKYECESGNTGGSGPGTQSPPSKATTTTKNPLCQVMPQMPACNAAETL